MNGPDLHTTPYGYVRPAKHPFKHDYDYEIDCEIDYDYDYEHEHEHDSGGRESVVATKMPILGSLYAVRWART